MSEVINAFEVRARKKREARMISDIVDRGHRIKDVRYRKPIFIECECGWRADARSIDQTEREWEDHRREQRRLSA